MINLEFDCVDLKGFKSFDHARLGLNYAGLNFMQGVNKAERRLGSNGAGKSTLWDSICWALFGRTCNGLRTPDIVTWDTRNRVRVTLHTLINGRPCKIIRKANPNSLTTERNGLIRDATQDQIERLIGFNFETFNHTILLGQGRPLFLDLAPNKKMEMFSDVLNLDRWDDRSKHAREGVITLEQRHAKVTGRLTTARDQLQELNATLSKVKAEARKWDAENDRQTIDTRTQLKAARAKLERVQNEHSKYDLTYDMANVELRQLRRNVPIIARALSDAQKDLYACKVKEASATREAARLQSEFDSLDKRDKCPTCRQPISPKTIARHKRELHELILDAKYDSAHAIPKKIQRKHDELKRELDQNRQHSLTFHQKVDAARDELDRSNEEVAEASTIVAHLTKLAAVKVDEINPFATQLKDLRKRHATLSTTIEDNERRLRIINRKIARTKLWVPGFRNIRLQLIDDVLQELELVTNTMLADIGLENWEIRYDIEKETKKGTVVQQIQVTILSPKNKKPVKWQAFSGGEGQRLRLVGAFALSEVLLNNAGVQSNLEVLDEPTRGLSNEGIDDLCDLLTERARTQRKAIWLVAHQGMDTHRFASTVTVTKTAGGSAIRGTAS